MKQFLFFLSLMTLIQIAYAADANSDQVLAKTEQLILSEAFFDKQAIKDNKTGIQALSLSNREYLYEKYQKFDFPLLNSIINSYIPGLGSWLQGDWKGALFIEVGFLGSAAACYLTYDMTKSFNQFYGMSMTSLIMFALISLIRPFTYARDWNAGLRDLLSYTGETGVLMDPFPASVCRRDNGLTVNLLAFRF